MHFGPRFPCWWKTLQRRPLLHMYLCEWYIDMSTQYVPRAGMCTGISEINARRMLSALSSHCRSQINVHGWWSNLSGTYIHHNNNKHSLFFTYQNTFYSSAFFQSNETWNLDPCRACRCHAGEIRCAQTKCPMNKCRANEVEVTPPGQCCSICQESKWHSPQN